MQLAVLALLAAGCSSSGAIQPADLSPRLDLSPLASVLILGEWQEPGSGYILRFTGDGKQALATVASQLDTMPLLTGTWTLPDEKHLTFVSETGVCASPVSDQVGHYLVSVSEQTLIFVVDMDSCAQRATIDGESWTRVSGG